MPTSPAPRFTCTAPGIAVLTLTVGDGPLPTGSSCDPLLNTRSVRVRCDRPGGIPPVPAIPPWAALLLCAGLARVGAGFRSARTGTSRRTDRNSVG
jgi:hypothetical protein